MPVAQHEGDLTPHAEIDLEYSECFGLALKLARRDDPAALYQLHSEVSRLATTVRRRDPDYMQRLEMGRYAYEHRARK